MITKSGRLHHLPHQTPNAYPLQDLLFLVMLICNPYSDRALGGMNWRFGEEDDVGQKAEGP